MEGFDEGAGKLIVKMAVEGNTISGNKYSASSDKNDIFEEFQNSKLV